MCMCVHFYFGVHICVLISKYVRAVKKICACIQSFICMHIFSELKFECAYMYVHTYACRYRRAYSHIFICAHTYTHISQFLHAHIKTWARIYIYACIHKYKYQNSCMHICIQYCNMWLFISVLCTYYPPHSHMYMAEALEKEHTHC